MRTPYLELYRRFHAALVGYEYLHGLVAAYGLWDRWVEWEKRHGYYTV